MLELQQGPGVHYSVVAERLGVSPWTAYDVLGHLAQLGYLEALPNKKEEGRRGRSRMLFSLTPRAYEPSSGVPAADWQQLEDQLKAALACRSEHQFAASIRHRLADIARYRSPLLYCSHTVLLFALCLRALTRDSEANTVVGQVAAIMGGSQNVLLSLAGGVMALFILRRQSSRLLPALTANMSEYERNLAALREPERESLLRFTRRALSQITSERRG